MACQIQCSNCGKALILGSAEDGGTILCVACGAQVQIPLLQVSPAAPPTPAASFVKAAPPPANAAPSPSPRRWLPAAAIAVCLALALAAGAIAIWLRFGARPMDPQEAWERTNHARLLALKSEAEALAVADKLPEAHAKYRELQQLIGGRAIKDPQLWDLMDRARQDQDQIYQILLGTIAARQAPQLPIAGMAATQPAIDPSLTNPDPSQFGVITATPATTPAQSAAEAKPATAPAAPAAQQAGRPPIIRTTPKPDGVSDAEIEQAMKKGVDFLLRQLKDNQIAARGNYNQTYHAGLNALCVYALLRSGQAIKDDRLTIRSDLMRGLIDRMKQHPMGGNNQTPAGAPVTYARSLRAAALSVHNRREDHEALKADVNWLIQAAREGAYTYDDRLAKGTPFGNGRVLPVILPPSKAPGNIQFYIDPGDPRIFLHCPATPRPIPGSAIFTPRSRPQTLPDSILWDNSNSQYGVFGVWCGAEAGIEVPNEYWREVEEHWTTYQFPTGEWGYNARSTAGYLAMTVGGIASLWATYDYLDARDLAGNVGRIPLLPPLAQGLAWLETGDNGVNVAAGSVQYMGYNLFGLARAASAGGFKYLGKHDWYRELATQVVGSQWPNGAWGRQSEGADAIINTAYALLFLSYGRHPVMMNKMRFDGCWANRPRDLANLSRFAGYELERAMGWQTVSFEHPWWDWMDSPVLFIASHEAVRFREEDYEALRQFVEGGGLLFTHSDGVTRSFDEFVANLAHKLFPAYEFADLPQDHEIYSLHYQVDPKPPLRGVSNGARLLMVHAPVDMAMAWQARAVKTQRNLHEMGVNIFLYAAGKVDLRTRLSSPYIPEPQQPPGTLVKLARLKYEGNWNPEPYSWVRFARCFGWETGWGLDVAEVNLQDLQPQTAPLAHLTGTTAFAPSDEEAKALRGYVEAGGVLLIDACGGVADFARSVPTNLLAKAFPGATLQPLPITHPILAGGGDGMENLASPKLRQYAMDKVPANAPALQSFTFGKGRVIVSSLDLSVGLLGTNTWSIVGFQPAYAQGLVKNLVLWAADPARPQ